MDSFDDEVSLPIDLDQTGNFGRFLMQHQINTPKNESFKSESQSDILQTGPNESQNGNEGKKLEKDSNITNEANMERPSSRGGLMREQENIISELKKECFGLKMRIYYMEERLHDMYDADTENVIKANIELKVNIEHLKNDLQEKSDLLHQASQAMEQMVLQKEGQKIELAKAMLEEEVNKVKTNEREKYQQILACKNKDMEKLVEEIDTLSKRLLEKDAELGSKCSLIENLQTEVSGGKTDKEKLSELEKENIKLRLKIQELSKFQEEQKKMVHQDYDTYYSKEKELTSQKDLIIELQDQLKQQKLKSHKQVEIQERNVKNLRACLHEKEMEIQKVKTSYEEKVSVAADEHELHKLKLNFADERESLLKECSNKLFEKQSKIDQLEQLCKELKMKYLNELKYKDSVILDLVHATFTKDAFIKNLISTAADEETKKSQEYAIKQLHIELQEKERKQQKLLEHHFHELADKENELTEINKKITEKDSIIKSLETKYALVREEYKSMEINAHEQQKIIDQLNMSFHTASEKEKELSAACMNELSQKDKLIDQLTNILSSKETDMKKLEEYFDKLIHNASDTASINEMKKISENIYCMVKSNLDEKNELVKELCLLRKAFLSSEGKRFDQLLVLMEKRETEVKKLQAMLINQQEEKNEMLKELNKQLVGTEQELKQLNTALLNLQASQEMELKFLHSSIKEKDEAITCLAKRSEEKDCLIEELKIQLDDLKLMTTKEKSLNGADNMEESHVNVKNTLDRLDAMKKLSEREKEKYLDFFEKVENNLHPESLRQVIENEINEFTDLRGKMQDLFVMTFSSNPSLEKLQDGILIEHFQLKNLLFEGKKSLKSAHFQNSSLHEKVDTLEDQLQTSKEKLDTLKTSLIEKDEEIKLVQHKCISIQKKFDDLQKAFDNVVSEHSSCKLSNKQMVEDLQKQLSKQNNRNALLETDNGNLKKDIEEFRSRATSIVAENADLQNKLSGITVTGENEKRSLKKDIKELCSINERLRNKIKEVNKRLETLKVEKEADRKYHDEKMQNLNENIKEINKERQKLLKKIVEYEEKFSQIKDAEFSSIISKCETLEKSIAELQNKEESHMNKQINLNARNISLSNENNSLKHEIASLKSNLESKTRNENEVLTSKQEVLEKQLQINILQNDLSHYKDKCDDCQCLVANLTSQNEYLKHENEVFVSKQKSLKNQLHAALIDQKEFARLQHELECLRERKESLESQLKELGDSAGGIKSKLSASHDENLAKEKEIRHLRSHIVQLEEQIESFSPIHTSSRQNIAFSSDVFTQTMSSKDRKENTDDNSLIATHIAEMRELRKQLAETISNNDNLRKQLEERLMQIESDAKHIHDPVMRVNLVRENDAMRSKLTEKDTQVEKMKTQLDAMQNEKESNEETIKKLQDQIHDLNELSMHLKLEMEAYDRLVQKLGIHQMKNMNTADNETNLQDDKNLDKNLLLALLKEIRNLREQLQQSIDVNNALREKLEEELGRPVSISPFQTPYCKPSKGHSAKRSLFSSVLHSVSVNVGDDKYHHMSPDETPTKDNDDSWSYHLDRSKLSDKSPYLLLSVKSIDFDLLKQLIRTCARIVSTLNKEQEHLKSKEKTTNVRDDLIEVYRILKEIWNILLQFQVETLDDDVTMSENGRLRLKINEMQKSLSAKDEYIKSTLNLLMNKYTNHENIEQAIADKLLKAKETIKTTKGNLKSKSLKSRKLDSSGDSDKL